MQIIRPELYSAYENEADAAFIAKLAEAVREAVPSLADEPEPAFSAQIRLLVQEARSFNLMSEQAIGVFVVTAGLLGVNFVEEHSAAKEILEGNETEEKKAELLQALTLMLFEALDQ